MRRLLGLVLVGSLLTIGGPAPSVGAQAAPSAPGFATDGDLVEWAYQHVFDRAPDPGGLSYWRGRDPVALLSALLGSPESDAWTGQVLRAYRVAYGRAADLEGLRHWIRPRQGGGGPSFVAVGGYGNFVQSAEFDTLYGGVDDAEFVRRVYVQAFDRAPDAAGQAYWLGVLRSTSRPVVLGAIAESTEHVVRRTAEVRITSAYAALLGRLPDPSAVGHWSSTVLCCPSDVVRGIWSSPELAGRLPVAPALSVTTVLDGLTVPWGLTFAPDGTMLLTQRPGVLTVRLADGTVRDLDADLSDVRAESEGGLLDVALDPDFADNRRFYTCQGRRSPRDVAVVAWTVDAAWTTATRVADPLLAGIPQTSGRHSGCRIAADPSEAGVLLVATGDAAIGTAPQDLSSLGGKLLRISSVTGEGVPGNPLYDRSSDPDTRRIAQYGHRNLQGLAVDPVTGVVVTVEHGPDRDDEINVATGDVDYGWDPAGPGGSYDESVPMTRPGAVPAVWSSGVPTLATSGATFLDGCQWGAWDRHLAVATLKGQHLRVQGLGGRYQDLGAVVPTALDGSYGRLRTVVQGPDGALYVTTSNGLGDRVLRVSPSGGRCAAPAVP